MDAALLKNPRSFDAFPGGGHLDEDALGMDASSLIKLDQALGPGDSGLGVEGQAGIYLGGDAARDGVQNFTAKANQNAVHDFVQRLALELGDRGTHQRGIFGLLNRFENQ